MKPRLPNFICVAILLTGLSALYPLQKLFDRNFSGNRTVEESIYLNSGKTIKRLSIGFDGLVADLYWIRSVQYFGRKFLGELGEDVDPNRLNKKNMPLLAPYLDIITDIDPRFAIAYSYGAAFLGEFDSDSAVALLRKGIANLRVVAQQQTDPTRTNIQICLMYQQMGYTYWRAKHYEESSAAYLEGSRIPGAPKWMEGMAATVKLSGGDRATAYRIFAEGLNNADEDSIKATFQYRLYHLQSLDQRDFLNRMVAEFQRDRGFCPTSTRELSPYIRANVQSARDALGRRIELKFNESGEVVDPGDSAAPYVIDPQTCHVKLNPTSLIPAYWDKELF